MPSRKSNVSTITNGETASPAPAPSSASRKGKEREDLSVEDLNLPKTMIQRLAKGVLPPNTQVQKDALLALSKSATVFVNFLAASASENATASGKKTISPNDVFAALKDHEFDSFLPRVQAEVQRYNEVQCDKRNSYRRRVKADKATSAPGSENVDDVTVSSEQTTNGRRDGEEEPPSKRVRRESGDELEEDEDGDDEDGEDDGGEDEAEDEEDDVEEEGDDDDDDENMDDAEEHTEQVEEDDERMDAGIRDEALDEPDSD